ncbi:MAG: glycosyltransferase family 2 protein [Rhodospirillales bacterium]|nr:glycosyltransferase family 2 protein [Rhodospirillales bacterium]
MPHISVIVPCHNAQAFIQRCLESAVGQTDRDLEIVVVDDASTDGTRDVIKEMSAQDSRIRLIERETNGGAGCARNTGIDAATGDWIAVLDADDWYDPQRLEVLISAAEKDGALIVADNQYFVSERSGRPWQVLRDKIGQDATRLSCDDLLLGDHLSKSRNFGLLKPVIQRKFLLESGIRYDEEPGIGEDFYFLLKCVQRASHILFLSKPMYFYRTHSKSLTRSLSSSQIIPLRTYHDRCSELFKGVVPDSTQTLMETRGRQIETYMRYKLVVTALREGNIKVGFLKIISDPPVLALLARALFFRVARKVMARFLRRNLQWDIG